MYYLPKISSDKDLKTAIIVSIFERIPKEELTGHRVFIRTAELSSITKAAESLGLTRAAASRALMSLESELGAALFTRTTRHVALTAFGSQVLDTCKELVGLADQLKAEALHQSSAPTGTIRVACSVSFGQTYLEIGRAHV